MILSKDDNTVPKNDPITLYEELRKLNIKSFLELVDNGGHGFGLGDHTDAKGYIERFVKFIGK